MQNFSSNLWKSDFPLRISHFIFLIIIIADSYVAGAAREAGSAAELAAARKAGGQIPALTVDTYLNPLR